jgi:hypothetical protein
VDVELAPRGAQKEEVEMEATKLEVGHAHLQCAVWYVANRSVDEMLTWFYDSKESPGGATVEQRRSFGDPHLAEMTKVFMSRDLVKIYCRLDVKNQRRFLAECARIYLAEASPRVSRAYEVRP